MHKVCENEDLFHKSLFSPFQTVPTLYKDNTTKIFIQHKRTPHTYQSPSPMNAEQETTTYGNTPLNNKSYIKRIISGLSVNQLNKVCPIKAQIQDKTKETKIEIRITYLPNR